MHTADFRVSEERDVKVCRFLSFVVEPQEGNDLLHDCLSIKL